MHKARTTILLHMHLSYQLFLERVKRNFYIANNFHLNNLTYTIKYVIYTQYIIHDTHLKSIIIAFYKIVIGMILINLLVKGVDCSLTMFLFLFVLFSELVLIEIHFYTSEFPFYRLLGILMTNEV